MFELEVLNSQGDRSPEVVSLPITILKYWYELTAVRIAGVILLLGLILGAYRLRVQQIRSRERMNASFQKQLAEVEMTALRAQMNPHFIFNCLNSIESFVVKNDTLKASTYLNDFARLIRLILQNSRSKFVPLRDELEALELYLEMESLRFVNRFEYEINIDENVNINSVEVPPMIIQPYVENAIWHGLMHKEEKGMISIDIDRVNGMLHCSIEDDGIGREKSAEINASKAKRHKSSMGMQITQDRIAMLNELYQTHTSINIIDLYSHDGRPSGTRVELDIPV